MDGKFNQEIYKNQCKPFLRWAGGKQKIVKTLQQHLPAKKFSRYWEPFLGSGALFFALEPKESFLSDNNKSLIDCYIDVRDNPDLVYPIVVKHLKNSTEKYYYRIREEFNNSKPSIEQSARFIYLNKTNYNGIYRVNSSGKYNVPYGYREPPPPLHEKHFFRVSKIVKNKSFKSCPYDSVLSSKSFTINDFFYVDPPYPPKDNKNNSFNHYTFPRFYWDDHVKLAKALSKMSAKIMVSYLDVSHIRELYSEWNFFSFPVRRYISSDGNRNIIDELLITNY